MVQRPEAGSGGGLGGAGAGGAATAGAGGVAMPGVGGAVATGGHIAGASGGTGTGGTAGTGGAGGLVGGAGGLLGGIGDEWKWRTGVQAHIAGPYHPCGAIGSGQVTWGAASPNGLEVASASPTGVVMFFGLETGAQVRAPFHAGGPVLGVDYTRDGTRLIVAGDAGVQIVNLADGRVLSTSRAFAFPRGAALSPDGSYLAELGWDVAPNGLGNDPPRGGDLILRVVRVADDHVVAEEPSVSVDDGVAPQFSPDGAFIVVGSLLLSIPNLQPLPISPLQSSGNTALSSDGTMVAQAGTVWEVASRRELKPPSDYPSNWVAFSPDGATYAELQSNSGTVLHLFRTSDWSEIGSATIDFREAGVGHSLNDGRFFFSGDGRRVISTLSAQYSVADDLPIFQITPVSDLTSTTIAAEPRPFWAGPGTFSPDGSVLVTRLAMTTAVWRAADLAPISHIAASAQVYSFLGNGLVALDGAWVYDPADGHRVGLPSDWLLGVSPDGTLAASLDSSATPDIIRLSDLRAISTVAAPSFAGAKFIFSRDNRFLAYAGTDRNASGILMVFDGSTGQTLTTIAGEGLIAIAPAVNGATRLVSAISDTRDLRVRSIPDGLVLYDISLRRRR